MASKGVGIVFLIIGMTFCVLKLVGYASGAFVAIGASFIAIGAGLLSQQRRGPRPPQAE